MVSMTFGIYVPLQLIICQGLVSPHFCCPYEFQWHVFGVEPLKVCLVIWLFTLVQGEEVSLLLIGNVRYMLVIFKLIWDILDVLQETHDAYTTSYFFIILIVFHLGPHNLVTLYPYYKSWLCAVPVQCVHSVQKYVHFILPHQYQCIVLLLAHCHCIRDMYGRNQWLFQGGFVSLVCHYVLLTYYAIFHRVVLNWSKCIYYETSKILPFRSSYCTSNQV